MGRNKRKPTRLKKRDDAIKKKQSISSADQRIINNIVGRFVSRTKQDIGDWRAAQILAEHPTEPNRIPLYNIFRDIELDEQVITCVRNLKASLKAEGFFIGDAKTREKDEKLTKLFRRPWMYDILDAIIDSHNQGFVLMEIDKVVNGEITNVEEIPREHVIPELDFVIIDFDDELGYDIGESIFDKTLIKIGKKKNLGLLNALAPKALYKKNVEAAWAEFCEMFGMPIRVGKVASGSKTDMDRMENFLQAMGSAAYAVTGADDTVELKESSKGDAYNVYDKFMERQDKGISKILLGGTMTTDDGSSRSQAEVHERVSDKRMFEMKLFTEFFINLQLFNILKLNGYKLEGKEFYWDEVTKIEKIDIEKDKFLIEHFELENLDYFVNKYRVPITGLKEKLGITPIKDKEKKEETEKELNYAARLNHSMKLLYGDA